MKFNDDFEIVKGVVARNRIVMAPMCTVYSEDGFVNDFHIQHYGSRSYGGVGSIIVESTAVLRNGVITTNDLGVWSDEHIEGLSRVAKIIKKGGAIAGIQLNHAASKAEVLGMRKYGVTLKHYDYLDQSQLEMLNVETEKEIIDAFYNAAKRVESAGFDFIEIHAAHGYFFSNLMGKLTNDYVITDDIVKRSKMLFDTLRKIKDNLSIKIGIRISFSDHTKDGMEEEDYYPLIKELEKHVDFFHVSSGSTIINERIEDLVAKNGKLFRLDIAKNVKKNTSKNVIVVGNFESKEDIDLAFNQGIDAVAIGRELLFSPSVVIEKYMKKENFNEKYHWNNNPWFDFGKHKKDN